VSEEKILHRDDKLLRKEKNFRICRIAAVFVLAVQPVLHIDSIYPFKLNFGVDSLLIPMICWFSVAGFNTLLLHHIESIKLYRSKMK
jgi:hypothetical protein